MPWAPKPGGGLSVKEGDLATSFARDGSRFQVEAFFGEEFRTSVNARVLRRSNIYTMSKARAVQSMLFEIEWDEQVCAGLPRGVL